MFKIVKRKPKKNSCLKLNKRFIKIVHTCSWNICVNEGTFTEKKLVVMTVINVYQSKYSAIIKF